MAPIENKWSRKQHQTHVLQPNKYMLIWNSLLKNNESSIDIIITYMVFCNKCNYYTVSSSSSCYAHDMFWVTDISIDNISSNCKVHSVLCIWYNVSDDEHKYVYLCKQ